MTDTKSEAKFSERNILQPGGAALVQAEEAACRNCDVRLRPPLFVLVSGKKAEMMLQTRIREQQGSLASLVNKNSQRPNHEMCLSATHTELVNNCVTKSCSLYSIYLIKLSRCDGNTE